jgi:hypothetical protein
MPTSLCKALALSTALALIPAAESGAVESQDTNSVHASGPTLGSLQLKANKCLSGGHWLFRGAEIFDETTQEVLVLRLVLDPIEGPIVRFYKDSEWGPSIVLRRPDCEKLEFDLHRTGVMVNGVEEVHVSLQLDCRSAAGDVVTGRVDLPACR